MSSPLQPSLRGKLVQWDREKGYGFIDATDRRVFIHWRDFSLPRREPSIGESIGFNMGLDKEGRPCATDAIILPQVVHAPRVRRGRSGLLVVLVAWPLLLFLPIKAALWHGIPIHWIAAYVPVINTLTYLIYKVDKQRAQEGGWRISERALHLFELLGGWPGALLAQQRLRHKSVKFDYRFWFWLIVIAYQFAAYDSMQHWQWTNATLKRFDRGAAHHR